MGMLIEGRWFDDADRTMQDGAYRREASALPDRLDADAIAAIRARPGDMVLLASASCPWSHGAVLARVFKGLDRIAMQWAGGPRVEGYTLLPRGPLAEDAGVRFTHELYTATDAAYTGRATVPVLWDKQAERILSNSSADIIRAFDEAGDGAPLYPADIGAAEIDALIAANFDGLSNAVYRAGKAQRQSEYDEAVDLVFSTLAHLEDRLTGQRYLFGDTLTAADIRLFATLVRFDTVYATHFRCTRRRLVDHPALWRFTRRIYQRPGVRETVDFDEIRFGYYVNDGDHNPHGIVGQQPEIDWEDQSGL